MFNFFYNLAADV